MLESGRVDYLMKEQNHLQRFMINQLYSVWKLVRNQAIEGFVLRLVLLRSSSIPSKKQQSDLLLSIVNYAKSEGTGSA